MNIEQLVNRFEHYARSHKDLKHDPAGRRTVAFLLWDIEDLQDRITDGLKFPALLLQAPGVEKQGTYDNRAEATDFTYIVLNHGSKKKKSMLISEAKVISDVIYNRLSLMFRRIKKSMA